MYLRLCAALFATGVSGICVQIILIRQLWENFAGNELYLGLLLAHWVVAEAAGAFFARFLSRQEKNAYRWYMAGVVLFVVSALVSLYWLHFAKALVNVSYAETLPPLVFFWLSMAVLFPVAFFHGGLFVLGVRLIPVNLNQPSKGIAKAYVLETLGALAGGGLLTWVLLPLCNNPFEIFMYIALANIVAALVLVWRRLRPWALASCIVFAVGVVSIQLAGVSNALLRFSLRAQFPEGKVLEYRNSAYGSLALLRQSSQDTLFYDGTALITTPQPNTAFVEEFAHMSLLAHAKPSDVLIIGSGAGGLIKELLKHPVKRIDYLEIDPQIIALIRAYADAGIEKELNDPRVHIVHVDARQFLRQTDTLYDCILIGGPPQAQLTINRFFTAEFFARVKNRLRTDGLLALWIPGSTSYMSKELWEVHSSITRAVASAFGTFFAIPGEHTIIVAFASKSLPLLTSGVILPRVIERNLVFDYLSSRQLAYMLDDSRRAQYLASLQKIRARMNTDDCPYAVYSLLRWWNAQFAGFFGGVFAWGSGIRLWHCVLVVVAVFAALALRFRKIRSPLRLSLGATLFSTGFWGMMMTLVLLFLYQITWGCVYYKIGLLTGVFMAGSALGAYVLSLNKIQRKTSVEWLMRFEFILGGVSLMLAILAATLLPTHTIPEAIFTLIFLVAGFCVGAEFSLASRISVRFAKGAHFVASSLYAWDLLGAWGAGMVGGALLLPILGVTHTLVFLGLLKLASALLLLVAGRAPLRVPYHS